MCAEDGTVEGPRILRIRITNHVERGIIPHLAMQNELYQGPCHSRTITSFTAFN